MPPTKKQPKMPASPPARLLQDFSLLGQAVALATAADDVGMTPSDLMGFPTRLAEAGLPTSIPQGMVREASRIQRDRIDGSLWRANSWIRDRVEEVFRGNDPKAALRPSPREVEEAVHQAALAAEQSKPRRSKPAADEPPPLPEVRKAPIPKRAF